VHTWRLETLGIKQRVRLVCMDMEDLSSQIRVLQTYRPNEVYSLAAQSFVGSPLISQASPDRSPVSGL